MRRFCFAGVAMLLVTVSSPACGARWSNADRDAIAKRERGAVALTRDAAADENVVTRDDTATDNASATTVLGANPTPGRTERSTAQAAPCSAPSTAVGVTNDDITVGTISTLSGPRPGFGVSAQSGVQAYVAYRNATGGVCGRKIKLLT